MSDTLPHHIYNQICFRVRPELGFGGACLQLYEFGGPRRYHEPDGLHPTPHEEQLLLVFPYLEENILEKARLGKWMKQVILAIRGSLSAGRLQYFHHSSMRMIRLNSQAARVEGMRKVPDTPLDFYLQPERLESAWKEILRQCEKDGFVEFRGCPVIWGQYSPMRYHGASAQAFQRLVQGWRGSMRMEWNPREGLYVDFANVVENKGFKAFAQGSITLRFNEYTNLSNPIRQNAAS
jgi:hypothetical protein